MDDLDDLLQCEQDLLQEAIGSPGELINLEKDHKLTVCKAYLACFFFMV